jgi:hypothetical protein
MFAFLKGLRLSIASTALSPEQMLIDEFDALEVRRRDLVCEQLDRLWTWFLHEFDGPVGFLGQAPATQDEFLGKLAIAEERSLLRKQTESGAYYYSAALLVRYLRGVLAGNTDPETLAISARVAWGVNRGHELRNGIVSRDMGA